MYKVRIHIENDCTFMDNQVFTDIAIATAPRVGEYVQLSDDQFIELSDKASVSIDVAKSYAPRWFQGKSYDCTEPKHENLDDINFEDASEVMRVMYKPADEIIYIELG
jgi:hypothetical protein